MSEKIRHMFNNIAGDYDKMNRIMSLGMDKKWRQFVVKKANLHNSEKLIDLATGTGDIIFEALKLYDLEATGLDFSSAMIKIARERDIKQKARWIEGNALELPFEKESFHAVTSGYLMRNVGDIPGAFSEQYRVLKPGGKVVCLDTTPPPKNILRPFITLYFKLIIPLLGKILAGNSKAYAYLTESTVNFKNAEEIREIMIEAGFINIEIKKFMFGTIAVHCGEKK